MELPTTTYERLVARYRARNEDRHIVVPGGFTAGQRRALDRAWADELRRRERTAR